MPSNEIFHPANAFNLSVYVPVHYDFSQIEYVAPFLEQYQGTIICLVYLPSGIQEVVFHLPFPKIVSCTLRCHKTY
jgi:ABC-type uncharacterized transport system permease subunit